MLYIEFPSEIELLKYKLCCGEFYECFQNCLRLKLPCKKLKLTLVNTVNKTREYIFANDIYEYGNIITNVVSYKSHLIICGLDCFSPFLGLAFQENSFSSKILMSYDSYYSEQNEIIDDGCYDYNFHLKYAKNDILDDIGNSSHDVAALSSDGNKLITYITEYDESSKDLSVTFKLYFKGIFKFSTRLNLGVSVYDELIGKDFNPIDTEVRRLLCSI